jgi:hypothetical protein
MDEFMTLRRLNIRIQGFPESYATEPYMTAEATTLAVGDALPPRPPPEMMAPLLHPPPVAIDPLLRTTETLDTRKAPTGGDDRSLYENHDENAEP